MEKNFSKDTLFLFFVLVTANDIVFQGVLMIRVIILNNFYSKTKIILNW